MIVASLVSVCPRFLVASLLTAAQLFIYFSTDNNTPTIMPDEENQQGESLDSSLAVPSLSLAMDHCLTSRSMALSNFTNLASYTCGCAVFVRAVFNLLAIMASWEAIYL